MIVATNVILVLLIIRPVRRLALVANQVSTGQLEGAELPVHGKDEIAELTASFNRLFTSLAKAMRLLGKSAGLRQAGDQYWPLIRRWLWTALRNFCRAAGDVISCARASHISRRFVELLEARRTSTPAIGPTCSASCRVISLSDSGRCVPVDRTAVGCGEPGLWLPGAVVCATLHLGNIACSRAPQPILSRAARNASAVCQRSRGSFASARITVAESAAGIFGWILFRRHRRVLQVGRDHLDMGCALDRQTACDHLVERDPDRVDVRSSIVRLARRCVLARCSAWSPPARLSS